VTADFVYIRFHGLKDGARHDYTKTELEPWAKFIRKQSRAGKNVYAYFNNDLNVHAPDNAKMLMEMVWKAAARPLVENELPITSRHQHPSSRETPSPKSQNNRRY
jgi:uncharacterized protein YecE (DUF72 family)